MNQWIMVILIQIPEKNNLQWQTRMVLCRAGALSFKRLRGQTLAV